MSLNFSAWICLIDPPVEFDMSLITEPKIVFEPLGDDPAVNLRCEVTFFNPSMESWHNVSYRFTWYMEGKHIHTDDICGPLAPGSNEYESECPGKPLFSRLLGSEKYYEPNRLVSLVTFVLFILRSPLFIMSKIYHGGKIRQKGIKKLFIMHMRKLSTWHVAR